MTRGRTGGRTGGTLLEVVGLTKGYGDLVVLDEVGFTLEPGRATAVVGPNGAGKSTLLRCVAGVDRVDAGRVLLDGADLDESAPATRAAVATALDDLAFFPDLSVVEHLRLCAWSHGSADPEALVADVLAELGLDAAADQLPATLSSGQRHRLALASCLVRPRRLLVLDEPEQRLDAGGRRWLADRLDAEKRAGVAVLLASHDEALVARVADGLVEVGR
ncbi:MULTISPECIES: ABC transporter ATP-binding protein [Actinosynnema]|uniref:ABC transporter ATP-binding protein n=1 Tax=Actinosynnema TaxID=40566 RepID=UPI0020A33453|nr:ABC transporter ATP-binding protein [Actinosynnema pretiosum]MCP2099036.1 ABC transporter [Actinosynnema pretiosum]